MKNILQSVSPHKSSSARVVDGKLILSFPEALTPILWQMELNEAKASALEVRAAGDGVYTLTLRTARGETLEIAPFEKREDAVAALMVIAKALESAHGQIRPFHHAAAPATESAAAIPSAAPVAPLKIRERKSAAGKWAAGILGVLFVFVLLNMWAYLSPRPPSGMGAASSAAPAGAGSAQSSAGVPVSADDYLKGM